MTRLPPKNSSQPSGTASSTFTSCRPTACSTTSSHPTAPTTSAPDNFIVLSTTITSNEPTTADLFTRMQSIVENLTAFEQRFETRLQHIEILQTQYMSTDDNPSPYNHHDIEETITTVNSSANNAILQLQSDIHDIQSSLPATFITTEDIDTIVTHRLASHPTTSHAPPRFATAQVYFDQLDASTQPCHSP
jgi:hypothetical protein